MPDTEQCVRCGWCCRKSACSFGKYDFAKQKCVHLVGLEPGEYSCAIHDWIETQPGSHIEPAFGTGCGPSLNSDRKWVMRRQRMQQSFDF